MLLKKLKKIVKESYDTQGVLDRETAFYVAEKLSRLDFKRYINLLKEENKKTTVMVKSPAPLSFKDQKTIESLYPDKKIEYIIDPSILLGTEIVNYDLVYTRNLKNTFEDLLSHIEAYDY